MKEVFIITIVAETTSPCGSVKPGDTFPLPGEYDSYEEAKKNIPQLEGLYQIQKYFRV